LTPAPTDLLERESALSALALASGAIAPGLGRCVIVSGEAGLGKTSLINASARAVASQVQWLQAGCDALHTPRPLGPLVDLSHVFPADLAHAVHAARTYNGLFPALLQWLQRAHPPVVLVIEDLHWADEATLDCVRYLGRRIGTAGFGLVLSLRPEAQATNVPLRQTLAALDAAASTRIELSPLSPQAVEQLARASSRRADGLHALTAGNPFYLQQLLQAQSGTLPGSLRDVVLAQADALLPALRDAADTLSCSPGGLELAHLAAMHPQVLAGDAAVDSPGASTLLQVRPPWVGFRHELARQVLEDALSPLKRWQRHQALFERLALPRPVQPPAGWLARRVHHAAAAGLSAEVFDMAPAAAAEAEAVAAYRDAVRLLRLALEHGTTAPAAARARLLDRLALRSHAVQALQDAQDARHQAIALWQQAGDSLACAASRAQLALQLTPDAQALVQAQIALQELAGRTGTSASTLVHSALAISLANVGQAAQALQHARQARQCADEVARGAGSAQLSPDDADLQARATSIAASVELSVAPSPQAFDQLAASIQQAMAAGRPERVAVPLVNFSSVALAHGEHARVLAATEQGIAYCRDRDLDLVLAHLYIRRALALAEQGRWDETLATLDMLDTMAAAPARQLASAAILRDRVAAWRGVGNDAAGWRSHLTAAREGRADLFPVFVCVAAAEAAWLRQDPAEAERLAHEGLAEDSSPWVQGQLRQCLRRAGAALPPAPSGLSPAHAAAEGGDWVRAAELWAERGAACEAALALAEGDEAAQRRALDQLMALGAEPAVQWLRRRLTSAGARGLSRGPYGHARQDPLGLTQRERQVAELLAQGLSNADIAARVHRSERTVAHHVSSLLGKLDVTSRSQVAARLQSGD
jgi:DNA-binding CsgD family transcriptional regulator